MIELLLLLAGGTLAGTLGGLLGIGGGIILMPILRFIAGLPPALAAGTCILAVFFTTLGGSYRHYRLGHIDVRSVLPLIVAGALSCAVFSSVFPFLAARSRFIDLGVGVVFGLISMRMIVEGILGATAKLHEQQGGSEVRGSLPLKTAVGACGGALPGLLGIGTGGVLVPAFAFIFKTPIKTAMGASLSCFCCNALVSSAFKLSQGYIDLWVALPLCVGTLFGSNLGAMLNRRFPSSAVKLLFGTVFCVVSVRFFLSFHSVMS